MGIVRVSIAAFYFETCMDRENLHPTRKTSIYRRWISESEEKQRLQECSHFDHCNIRDTKLFLNSQSYPYEI